MANLYNRINMAFHFPEVKGLLASTTERLLAAATLFALAVGSFILWFVNPSTAKIFPACPMLSLTGFACPGCGMTRGFHALLHGDVVTALDFNILVPFYAVAFLYLFASLVLLAVRGKGLPFKFVSPVALFGFLFVSILFGVVRNIPNYPFSWLFP